MSNKFKQNKCFLKLKEIAKGVIYRVPAKVGEYKFSCILGGYLDC